MAIVGSIVDPILGIAGAIINSVAQMALVPVTDHVGYMISCRKYVRVMQMKMRELNTSRISVEEHISRNTRNHLQIPSQIKDWLDQVEGIRANVANFPLDVITCCSLRIRHKLGQKAFKITEQIESLTRQLSLISWTDDPVPLGRVGSMNASTSASSSDDFPSREKTFTQALKALEPNQKFHMVALCGMGGVGKTRMMQRLKKAAEEKKLFNYIVGAVIGEKTDPFAIQEAIADYLGIQLNEKTKPARADKLREWFKKNSDGGVDFKVLLTSRDSHVCTMMGVEANSIINVGLLTEAEARSLFQQFVETSEPKLQKIGEDIVRKCCGLPIAIKTMACTLRNKRKDAWKDALLRIEHYDIHSVAPKVFETSYHNLQEDETKSTFLMCGLFPEDFDIPTEELMRYGWGLKIFDRLYTIREARNRLNTCIERLVQTNLLIESDDVGCVKMHDLVCAFVLGMFSEVEHASIVNHGNMPEWTENDITDSCKRISLTCKSMSKFPGDFKFPNLMILKLMHGDKSLRFPQDFYEGMEKLHVISYDKMKYPLLPLAPRCSTNIRVLHLTECSLKMFDCSCIGNLSNLEVLSFANSRIEWFFNNKAELKNMSFENLERFKISVGFSFDGNISMSSHSYEKMLQLVTNKGDVLDSKLNGLFLKTEVLFLSVHGMNDLEDVEVKLTHPPQSSSFCNLRVLVVSECVELRFLFKLHVANTLSNLEQMEVYECDNMEELIHTGIGGSGEETITFPKLKFLSLSGLPKLSGLCHNVNIIELPHLVDLKLKGIPGFTIIYPQNKLGTSSLLKEEVVIPKLETLQINDMENLEEIWPCELSGGEKVKLREIKVSNCEKLVNLFPHNPMSLLHHLEELKVKNCGSIESLFNIHLDCAGATGDEYNNSGLRIIKVISCDSLVNLFPCNPMSLLHHLEELQVENCGSIESLFNIDLDCVGAIGEEDNKNILRSINMKNLGKLREVWRIKGEYNSRPLIHGFQAIESIKIEKCKRFRNVFTPIIANFYPVALLEIHIEDCGENHESKEQVG
ncbi:hypothetical protein Lser_V15G04866 [Lactuca serriola]